MREPFYFPSTYTLIIYNTTFAVILDVQEVQVEIKKYLERACAFQVNSRLALLQTLLCSFVLSFI